MGCPEARDKFIALIWLHTFLLQLPCHQIIAGKDEGKTLRNVCVMDDTFESFRLDLEITVCNRILSGRSIQEMLQSHHNALIINNYVNYNLLVLQILQYNVIP